MRCFNCSNYVDALELLIEYQLQGCDGHVMKISNASFEVRIW